ncbi:MAG: phospholipase C, phosphocholine-specific [Ferruginibacter sp.]
MDTRRSFLKKAVILSGGTGFLQGLPASIQKAMAINPALGSSFYDAEHIVFLMQENRSFDHTYGTLQGVRGFNDPRAITLPGNNKVWLQTNKEGETYAPFRLDIKDTRITWMGCLPHSWDNQVDARNDGKFDKWLDVKHSGEKEFEAMPLTMGYYNRADIPFYYSLADAFTVCDQHFCSSLAGTTPNRLHFWSGTIREKQEAAAQAKVWNSDADYINEVGWKTYPERLEENGISWKIYQNEISAGVGLEGEADGWLANFGDNPVEYFKQYNVRMSAGYIANLPKRRSTLEREITELEQKIKLPSQDAEEMEKWNKDISTKKHELETVISEQKIYTKEKYDGLSPFQKNIHDKAFTNNKNDPDFHELAPLQYKEGETSRSLNIPKGDILHQFREDVNKGELPTVSWLVAPQFFSDHPDSPWFGAWYVSEAMDILTANPEVWKKTIFILTYDENDGYYDHMPPFVAPNPYKENTGKVSEGIDAKLEFVTTEQQSESKYSRESAIGLGFRVPMVIASPWTRGGFVCSEIFDHTSSLVFLEKFLEKKSGKKIKETNINEWRRTVCGDLQSVFRPYHGEKINKPRFLEKEKFIQEIHKAKFRPVPGNYKKLSAEQIKDINLNGHLSRLMPKQEQGIRASCPLPYELYVNGNLDRQRNKMEISFKAGNMLFGDRSSGSPFYVYAINPYQNEEWRTWDYAVRAGYEEKDEWLVDKFTNGDYRLRVYGPNGFYREFAGSKQDPDINVACSYEWSKTGSKKLTGNISLVILNKESTAVTIEIKDNSYKTGTKKKLMKPNTTITIVLDQAKSYGWYDFSIAAIGNDSFEKRFAGHIETGGVSKTDPLMGQVF